MEPEEYLREEDEFYFETMGAPVAPGCGPDSDPPTPYNGRYNLAGPQVEFEAAWWLDGNTLPRVIALSDVRAKIGDPPPFFESEAELLADLNRLQNYVTRRDDLLPQGYLSDFLNLQKAPFGTIYNINAPQYRLTNVNNQHERITRGLPVGLPRVVVRRGKELARMFESETPGLFHQHALNWLLYSRPDVSPPRQARVWMALYTTIYSALGAAWYYKWGYGADDEVTPKQPNISFRLRPYEYVRDPNFVLYDRRVADSGSVSGNPHNSPCPSPGTPRHPAYPSGHSTYSAAASRILEYFFSPQTLASDDTSVFAELARLPANTPAERRARINSSIYAAAHLRKLKNNIGQARLFAGVHWMRDHEFGQTLGTAIADLMIEQLRSDCLPPIVQGDGVTPVNPAGRVPTDQEVLQSRSIRRNACSYPDTHDTIPTRDRKVGGFVVF
jgi:hypothetical protein